MKVRRLALAVLITLAILLTSVPAALAEDYVVVSGDTLFKIASRMLGDGNPLGVHLRMGRAWALAKQGELDQAARLCHVSRQAVLPQYLASFDQNYRQLEEYIREAKPPGLRLISCPSRGAGVSP